MVLSQGEAWTTFPSLSKRVKKAEEIKTKISDIGGEVEIK